MIEKSNLDKPILGFSDTETVKLDFDDMPFRKVKYWAFKIMKRFKLQGCIILKSSKNNYHAVFNRSVSWSENMKIAAWVSLLSHNQAMTKYLQMQCIKESSTLRVSEKLAKASPRVVFRYGRQDRQINSFLEFRRVIKAMERRLTSKP